MPDAFDPKDETRLARIERRAIRRVVIMVVLYSSLVVWAYFAMRLPGVVVVLPAMIVFGAFIVRHSMRSRRRARSARRSVEAARAFLRTHFDRQIRSARRFRIVAPLLVAFTWGSILALRVHGSPVYWCGAIAIGVYLLVATVCAHFAIPKMLRARALYD